MARIWDEKFEGAGYEETWSSGETVGAGNTLNEDYATSSLSSPPAVWDDQCLQVIVDTAGEESFVGHDFGASPVVIGFYRLEIMVHSCTVANYQTLTVLRVVNPAYGIDFNLGINNNGGTLRWQLDAYTGTPENSYATFALDTFYRVEIKWDSTNKVFEWKIGGVSINSGTFTGTTYTGKILSLGARNHVCELYEDNFAIDDADWVGAEGGAAGGSIIPQAMMYYQQLEMNG
jgi:hypothetical protein